MVQITRSLGRLTAILILFACKNLAPINPGPVVDDPLPIKDAGESLCQQACTRWQILECLEGGQVCDKFKELTDECSRWIPCTKWCENMVARKPGILNLDCIVSVAADSCEALEDACSE